MIKNIFLPEKIGSYRIFPVRTLSVDIGKTQVTVTKSHEVGTATVVERIIRVQLPAGTLVDYNERVGATLKNIIATIGKYDRICTALSSSLVFFKELSLPFLDKEKIDMVLPYEMESLLPFSPEQAVMDCIVTHQDVSEKRSTVLVASVQKQHLADHIGLFQSAGLTPDIITVDLFSLYSAYKKMSSFIAPHDVDVLIDIGFSATRIVYITHGELKFIRTLSKGMSTLLKQISTQLNQPIASVYDQLIQQGVVDDHSVFQQAVVEALTDFCSTISFTLSSFGMKSGDATANRIFLVGGGAEIKNIAPLLTAQLAVETMVFPLELLSKIPAFTIKDTAHLNELSLLSVCMTIPSEIHDQFTLRRKEFSLEDPLLFQKQIITTGILTTAVLVMLIGQSMWQERRLKQSTQKSEKQIVSLLKNSFDLSAVKRIGDVIDEAQRKVTDQDRISHSFSGQTRTSLLNTLQKMSTSFDKEKLGLLLKKLTFNQDTLIVQGEVRHIEALKLFEEQLHEADLGTVLIPPQERKFNLTIALKHRAEPI